MHVPALSSVFLTEKPCPEKVVICCYIVVAKLVDKEQQRSLNDQYIKGIQTAFNDLCTFSSFLDSHVLRHCTKSCRYGGIEALLGI
jgi:hypothetical protein